MKKRDFLALEDWSPADVDGLLALAARIKRGEIGGGLEKKVLAMVFMDPSLRTRTSFETAMFLHGGHAVVLEPGKGSWTLETEPGAVMDGASVEHIIDAARVLGRYADALGVRAAVWTVAALTAASGVVVAVRMYETHHRLENDRHALTPSMMSVPAATLNCQR